MVAASGSSCQGSSGGGWVAVGGAGCWAVGSRSKNQVQVPTYPCILRDPSIYPQILIRRSRKPKTKAHLGAAVHTVCTLVVVDQVIEVNDTCLPCPIALLQSFICVRLRKDAAKVDKKWWHLHPPPRLSLGSSTDSAGSSRCSCSSLRRFCHPSWKQYSNLIHGFKFSRDRVRIRSDKYIRQSRAQICGQSENFL